MRRMATFGSLVLAGLAAAAQLVAQGATAAPAPAPARKAMFWKVSSADNVAWLLGSIHLGSKSMYPLPKEIEDAFERSTELLEQMKLVSGITAEMLEKSVAASAKQDPEEYGKHLQQAWISGDTGQMEKIMREQTSDAVEFAKAMVEDRNLHMADVAEQFLKGKEQAFVMVGAAHMVGPGGVVRILEKRGYRVEQVAIGGR